MNKYHYPLALRLMKFLVTSFQNYGTKIHFNYFKNEEGQYIRYGVIKKVDLMWDLFHWETLAGSSFMMRPY